MGEQQEKYLAYLRSQKGLSERSVEAYRKDMERFLAYLRKEGLDSQQIERAHFRAFLAELNYQRLSKSTINRIIAGVKSYIRFLVREGERDQADILEVESLKRPKHLPKFLFEKEVQELLDFECKDKSDYRDRLIIELLFSTGMRVSELVSVDVTDISHKAREIRITGKGNKERIVLFSKKCSEILDSYLKIRGQFPVLPGERALLLNVRGGRISDRSVRSILERRVKSSSLNRGVSPHALRHSFATFLLGKGADIKTVQSLLGHANLSTTQIYTHLTLEELKEVHATFHPHG